MLLTKEVEMALSGTSKKHFERMGYDLSKAIKKGKFSYIMVLTKDLAPSSGMIVDVLCDYCLSEGVETIIKKKYVTYLLERDKGVEKDCCGKCKGKKLRECNLINFGVPSTALIPDVREKQINTLIKRYGTSNLANIGEKKRKQTCLLKHGVEYHFQTDEFKYNNRQKNMEIYGVEYYSQTQEYKDKIINTNTNNIGHPYHFQTDEFKDQSKIKNMELYGVEYSSQREDVKQKVLETCMKKYGNHYIASDTLKKLCLEKYGNEIPMKSEELIKKRNETMYINGTVTTSVQQLHINNLLGGELNYFSGYYNLDIAFLEDMIYIEYGGGHDLSIIHGEKTREEFDICERKRYYYHKRRNWKMIRIISKRDKLPSNNIIIQMFEHAKEYLSSGHSWIKFDLNNNIIINSQGEFYYDYGKLKIMKKI